MKPILLILCGIGCDFFAALFFTWVGVKNRNRRMQAAIAATQHPNVSRIRHLMLEQVSLWGGKIRKFFSRIFMWRKRQAQGRAGLCGIKNESSRSGNLQNCNQYYKDFGPVIDRKLNDKQIELLKIRYKQWKEFFHANQSSPIITVAD